MKILNIKYSVSFTQLNSSIFLLLLCVACSCNLGNNNAEIQIEIDRLTSNEAKEMYLEEIYKNDQLIRNSEAESKVIFKHGYNSKEHKDFNKRMMKEDEINRIKIDKYLKKYGYPQKDHFSQKALDAPWIVIHHETNLGNRNYHFPMLYEAYLNNDLDGDKFAFYLNRSHQIEFKSSLIMEQAYNTEEQIDTLIALLDLNKYKSEIIEEMRKK